MKNFLVAAISSVTCLDLVQFCPSFTFLSSFQKNLILP